MRDIDRIIKFVEDDDRIPPVHKRVLINRIEPEPTRAELDRAKVDVYGPEHAFRSLNGAARCVAVIGLLSVEPLETCGRLANQHRTDTGSNPGGGA